MKKLESKNTTTPPFDQDDKKKMTDKQKQLKEILQLNHQESRKIKLDEASSLDNESQNLQKALLKFEYDLNPEVQKDLKKSFLLPSYSENKTDNYKTVSFTKGASFVFPSDFFKTGGFIKSPLNNGDINIELNKFKEDINNAFLRNNSIRDNSELRKPDDISVSETPITPAQNSVTDDIIRYSSLSRKRKKTFKDSLYHKITKNEELVKPLLTEPVQIDLAASQKQSRGTSHATLNRTCTTRKHKLELAKSSSDEEDITDDHWDSSKWIIHPKSRFKKIFDTMIGLLTIYTIIATPLFLAFDNARTLSLLVIELFIDIVYLSDCFLHFFVAIYDDIEDNLITNHRVIAQRYLTGWFWLDLFAGIPYGSIMNLLDNHSQSAGLSKFQRIAKVSRVFKITKIFKTKHFGLRKKKTSDSKSFRFFSLFFIGFLFVSHVSTCIWIYIAQFEYPNWISEYKYTDQRDINLYISSLYYNWATVFTVGYGDITPKNTLERFYAILIMSFGLCGYAFALSTLSSVVTSQDNFTQIFLDNYNNLQMVKFNYNIPDPLYMKIAKFLKYDYKNNKNEKYEFIQDLPANLKNLMITEMYNDFICNFKFLQYEDDNFRSRVIMLLRPVNFIKNEYVLFENEYLDEFILIRHGYLKILLGPGYSEEFIMKLYKFEHFGDILIFSNQRSPVSIKAGHGTTELFFITKKDLLAISLEFPEVFDKITLVSTYNYIVMLELVERRKEEFNTGRANIDRFDSNISKNSERGDNLFDSRGSGLISGQNSINGIEAQEFPFNTVIDDVDLDSVPPDVDRYLQDELIRFSRKKLKSFAKLQEEKFNSLCKKMFMKKNIIQ
jgi:CRP-like cAMP-binding protein